MLLLPSIEEGKALEKLVNCKIFHNMIIHAFNLERPLTNKQRNALCCLPEHDISTTLSLIEAQSRN